MRRTATSASSVTSSASRSALDLADRDAGRAGDRGCARALAGDGDPASGDRLRPGHRRPDPDPLQLRHSRRRRGDRAREPQVQPARPVRARSLAAIRSGSSTGASRSRSRWGSTRCRTGSAARGGDGAWPGLAALVNGRGRSAIRCAGVPRRPRPHPARDRSHPARPVHAIVEPAARACDRPRRSLAIRPSRSAGARCSRRASVSHLSSPFGVDVAFVLVPRMMWVSRARVHRR